MITKYYVGWTIVHLALNVKIIIFTSKLISYNNQILCRVDNFCPPCMKCQDHCFPSKLLAKFIQGGQLSPWHDQIVFTSKLLTKQILCRSDNYPPDMTIITAFTRKLLTKQFLYEFQIISTQYGIITFQLVTLNILLLRIYQCKGKDSLSLKV